MFPEGVALIVGGSGGIGQIVARCFVDAGTRVAITYRSRAADAQRIARDLGDAKVYAADVTKPETIATAVLSAIADHGRVHTVVFAAGKLPEQVYIGQCTQEQIRSALEVETVGFFNVVQATLPHMREKGGSYVTLGSAGVLSWAKKDGLSVIPKAANDSMVQGIAAEEGRFGVRANSVLVGVTEAGMFLTLQEQGVFDEAWKKKSLERQAIKRFGQPEEIGHAAVFLASDRAAFITGQLLSVTGGFAV